jgi:hypothetical protein
LVLDADLVVKNMAFAKALESTSALDEVMAAIEMTRDMLTVRPPRSIPL